MTLDAAVIVVIAELRQKVDQSEKTIINLTKANNSLADELTATKHQLATLMNQTAQATAQLKLVTGES
jgi:hypothetical protein